MKVPPKLYIDHFQFLPRLLVKEQTESTRLFFSDLIRRIGLGRPTSCLMPDNHGSLNNTKKIETGTGTAVAKVVGFYSLFHVLTFLSCQSLTKENSSPGPGLVFKIRHSRWKKLS